MEINNGISSIIVVLCLLTTAGTQVHANYCDPELCVNDGQHIGCNNDGSFDSKCPTDAKLLEINKASQNILVKEHNLVRQRWASGKGKFKINACRMTTMRWNTELASLAALNVKQCQMEHDECHNTKKFKFSGQNLYIVFYKGMAAPDVNQILLDAIKSWTSEEKDVKPEHLAAYPKNYDGPDIGHFTVLVNERNYAVGCAISNYKNDGGNTFLVACNYAATNIIDWPVMTSCKEPAENCQTGANPKYSALCSIKLTFNYISHHKKE